MTGPFIFIGTHRIREGKLEQYRQETPDFSRFVEEREPQLIAFNMYLDEKGEQVSIVQIHPDVGSMTTHMQVVRDHIANAYADTLGATISIQIYGELSDDALATMKQLAEGDVQFIVKQEHLAGFTRSTASSNTVPA